jgi:hypothetical protein
MCGSHNVPRQAFAPTRPGGESQGGITITVAPLAIRLSPEHRRVTTRPSLASAFFPGNNPCHHPRRRHQAYNHEAESVRRAEKCARTNRHRRRGMSWIRSQENDTDDGKVFSKLNTMHAI